MLLRSFCKDNVTYWIGVPAYPVSLFVDYFMACDGLPTFHKEFMFPNNRAEIFFNLGDVNFAYRNQVEPVFTFSKTIVSGLRSECLTIKPGNHFTLAGIRFNIFGFQNIFGIPSSEFTDRNFEVDEVWSCDSSLIREQLLSVKEISQKLIILEKWIQSKIDPEHVQNATLWNKLIPKLYNTTSPLRTYLSSLMGYSHKHIIDLFRERCGLPPKMIQRIFRFNRVLLKAGQGNVNWTTLSHDAGYSDQSHFIKEFKLFTGLTPTLFLKQQPKDWMLLKESR